MNTSNTRLDVEQFSLKTDWNPVEGLLHNQGCKKEPHIIEWGGKTSDWVRTVGIGGH